MNLKSNKKIGLVFLFSCTFLVTGCLEELLASLCDKLASNNSIIAIFQANPVNYSQQVVKLTYVNETNAGSYTVSQCDNKFEFPNGEIKENAGASPQNITFVSVLDETGDAFFFDENGMAKTDSIRLDISYYDNCEDLNANENMNSMFSSSAASLDWVNAVEMPEEDIPLLGECEITGQSAVIEVSEIL